MKEWFFLTTLLKYNLYTQMYPFKVYILIIFTTFTKLYNHHDHLFTVNSHSHPQP